MNKIIELLLGEAYKTGIQKLFGGKPEPKPKTSTSENLGCLVALLTVPLYPAGIYWLKPRLEVGSFLYEHIYTWPLYLLGLWIGYYVLKFILYCLITMPGSTLFVAGFLWFCWYAFKRGWF